MKAKVTKITENPSKFSGTFYYIFFSAEDGKSYKTCVGLAYRNFKHWQFVLQPTFDKNQWLDGLFLNPRDPRLIDADSKPIICPPNGAGEPGANGRSAHSTPALPLFPDQKWERGRARLKEAKELLNASR